MRTITANLCYSFRYAFHYVDTVAVTLYGNLDHNLFIVIAVCMFVYEKDKITEVEKAIKDYEVEEWVKAVCPLCKEDSDDSTKYAPQQLFDHLMGRGHTKWDLADFLQEEQTANHFYD